MTIDDKISYENLQYDISRESVEIQHYHQVKLINMNILQAKKQHPLVDAK